MWHHLSSPAHAPAAGSGTAPATAGDVAIVVPCFNEAAVIERTIQRLRAWFPSVRIVVIDDGSRDDTAARADAFAADDTHVVVSRLPHNGGKGLAVASALPLVGSAAVVVVDADLAYGRSSVCRAIDALAATDLAIGNRRHAESTYAVPVRLFGFLYRRHLLGIVFNWLVRAALGLPMRDTQCGLKAFRAAAFQQIMARLRTTGFAFDLEVLLLARGLGFHLMEIPVEVDIDSGRSSVRLVRDGLVALREVLVLSMRRLAGYYAPAHLNRPG